MIKPSRRERGSIVIYMAMCILLLGVLFGAVVPLATELRGRTTRRSDELKARLAFDAGVATLRSQSLAMTLVLGSPLAVSVNGVTGTLTTAANSALANTILVTGTMLRNGRSYRFSRVIGARQPAPFAFAICSNTDLTIKKATMGASGVDGDIFSNGNLTLQTGNGLVNGNIMAAGTLSPGSSTVTGRQLSAQTPIAWPTIYTTDYLVEATAQALVGNASVTTVTNSVNGLSFPAPVNGKYFLDYYALNLTLRGSISGKGTVYVDGNLTINNNITYANASSEVAIIVRGNVTINSAVSNVQGFIFCGGTFNPGNTLTIGRGAVATNAYSSSQDLTIVRDNAIRDDNDEAVRLRLPYYWP